MGLNLDLGYSCIAIYHLSSVQICVRNHFNVIFPRYFTVRETMLPRCFTCHNQSDLAN